ncbi:erythroblast NAD(P)(+)--arginine ADP-ribosyltransferase-like protein [Turdus rufiventris]|nr:erythroblast NAD(P)(+)--arginine ADP-ribosyltransferase-like protein [Turdus rufiventris]
MTVATTAIMLPLDMAWDSFDDQYQGCGSAMKAELPALKRSEFQKNSRFSELWPVARDIWKSRGSPVSPLSSSDQAIAIMACTMSPFFNGAVKVGGHSPQEYLENFHFKMLHFLVTDALATLRAAQGPKCHLVFLGVHYIWYKAKPGNIVRFGRFMSSSLSKSVAEEYRNTTVLQVQTCHGVDIKAFAEYPEVDEVLIPPLEKFKVTRVIKDGEKVEIHLDSIGNFSKYNCEWLKGGNSLGPWGNPLIRWERPQGPLPPRRTPPGHHSPGSGHRDPLSHNTTKVTKVTQVTVNHGHHGHLRVAGKKRQCLHAVLALGHEAVY